MINNVWFDPLPLDQCDHGSGCSEPATHVLALVSLSSEAVCERRPLCSAHLGTILRVGLPSDDLLRYDVFTLDGEPAEVSA